MNWQDVTIELPLPPSANDLVRPALVRGKVRLVSTREATEFRAEAVHLLQLLAAMHRSPPLLTGPVLVTAVFLVPTLASDCNNRWKALEDAITASGVVWNDDKQVSCGVSEKQFIHAGGRPWCRVQVEPRESEEHSRRLDEAAMRVSKPRKKRKRTHGTQATHLLPGEKINFKGDWRSSARPAVYR